MNWKNMKVEIRVFKGYKVVVQNHLPLKNQVSQGLQEI